MNIDNWTFNYFREKLETIERLLIEIKIQGENNMSQLDDLNTKITAVGTGIDNIGTALATATADIVKAFTDLKAAIAAGGTGPDLTTQNQALDSAIAKLADLSTAVSAVDTDALAADPTAATPAS